MSEIHVQQIKANLAKLFTQQIDLSDVQAATPVIREATFNTRALAAFVCYHFDDLEASAAGACVTDGTGDNGIDALHYSGSDKTLLIVQSKWHEDGRGSMEIGELHKLLAGFKDLVNLRNEQFSGKFIPHHQNIKAAVEDANTRFRLVFVTTGQDDLAPQAKTIIDPFLKEMNDPTEIVTFVHLRQGDLHGIIARNVRGNPINMDVQLFEWGMTREPFASYYGQVDASELARWYKDHHNRLFEPNLRLFLGTTDANLAMIETATKTPHNFWYFNNGVTAVCDTIRKKPIGGASRESGTFECTNVRVVNGAQTIGSLSTAHSREPDAVSQSRVLTRFISLEQCPPDFTLAITKGTNTQNRIELRDFAALDPEQARLADELSIDQITYAYKSGEQVTDRQNGFDLDEATVCLASSHTDPNMAVQAKREISRLWENITRAPYKALFNPGLSGRKLWRLVRLQRAIDDALRDIPQKKQLAGREAMVPVHGNRILAHLVYRRLELKDLNNAQFDIEPLIKTVANETMVVTLAACEVINNEYSDSYLASLFKNQTKCLSLVQEITYRISKRDSPDATVAAAG